MSPFDHPGPRRIERVARHLGDLRGDVVFAGGSLVPLLVTDPLVVRFRETKDVDFVVEVVSRAEFGRFAEALRARGFRHVAEPGAPVCRFEIDGVLVDAMPLGSDVFGFSNRWYPYGLAHAVVVTTPGGLAVRHLSASAFLATKLEAFRGRGRGDHLGSHDLEDVVTVLDGRPRIVDEVREAAPLHAYLGGVARDLLSDGRFLDALPGHLEQGPVTAAREAVVLDRLRQIAAFAGG